MARKTKVDVRQEAQEIVQFFNAVVRVDDDAVVKRGTYEHLDPDIPPSKGHWVASWVFVAEQEY